MAPTTSGSVLIGNEDTSFTGTLLASDPEMSTLTYTVDILPTNGILTLSGVGNFQYTPNANYLGTDSFSFHVNDGIVDSNISIVNITVSSVNDIPTVISGRYLNKPQQSYLR